ncbi:glycosyltransferase [Bradyrhizobium genosp. P]|uniref:glycosyltransferase n=1 Tax=Bradyrhizobium genosp. P TaxID=83641 RepID=UPI003CF3C7C8
MPVNKKTVLVYRNELLPVSETFIKEQILALKDWRAVLVGRERLDGLPLDDLSIRIIGAASSAFSSRAFWKAHRLLRITPSRIKRSLEAEAPSLVHAHFGPDALDAWPLARALNLPMLVTLHGYDINTYRDWWEAGNAGAIMRSYPKRLLELASEPRVSFIAVSEAIRRRAIEFGISGGKVRVRYIGINSTKFRPGVTPITQRDPRVLFVGRLVEKKGCQYLIEAMSIVQNNVPTAQLIIVGSGPLRERLEHLARKLGVNSNFRGSQSSAYIKQELDAARVFCLPSVTAASGDAEGLPISILEAQAAGVPVVTSARGAVGEAVKHRVSGLVVRERDVPGLASELLTLLTVDNLASEISTGGIRSAASAFDCGILTSKLESTYDEVSLLKTQR